MRKNNLARGNTTRGDSSIRGGKSRGSASSRGSSTSKGTLTARGSPLSTLTIRGGNDASPIRSTIIARGGLTSRGKGKDPLLRTRDDNIDKNGSKKSEKKIYKVSLTNAIVKKLIAAKSQMKINISDVSDKMEIHTGEGEKIQLNLSSPKKAEMIYIRNGDIVEPIGNVIGCASTTMESHEAAKRDLTIKKMMKESYEEESKKKRRVQVLEINKIPSEHGKTKSKRQKNNAGSSIKVQQSPSIGYLPSSKVSPQLSNVARGSKPLRGKTRGGRTKTSINTTVATEVTDINDESTITTASVRGGNITRSGKTTGGGKSTRGRGAKTIISDAQKVSAPAAQSTTSTRGKRGRPAGVTNRTTRGAKTYTAMTTRTSTSAFKTSAIVKNDNDQLSMSEGTASSSSKKGKGKTNGQPALSEWKPGQTITILTEFRQARKICEEMENDIQEVIEDLGAYENFYNTYVSSIKNVIRGPTHDLLREIEKQFGEGSSANKLMQKYLQLEKDIKIIYDELWRAAKEGPIYED
ncbi:hypothetical protein RclHR1_07330011 [Rhizophagus clarus]|uniref:Uncharacterized protein n=1 Tax=Rhizophagus clarus TaxID=94130 RepID=A0A2Z6S2K2_9GLOM|nr:hypothetical protein RclHR1_07330011 [Rhizophagus clarus]GES93197.1 hypothetical protein GLOIN_2v1717427 [Rhizophagus clarus]